jgi:hypothetical protein
MFPILKHPKPIPQKSFSIFLNKYRELLLELPEILFINFINKKLRLDSIIAI